MGKGKLQVLSNILQLKVFGVEEKKSVQEDNWRISAQLLALPQMFFFNAREHVTWIEEGLGGKGEEWRGVKQH